MTELHAPQRIRRKNTEIKSQLSQNREDPERQKDLDGMNVKLKDEVSSRKQNGHAYGTSCLK